MIPRKSPYRVGSASPIFEKFMKPSRYKALYGGRGSAKSHAMAEFLIANAAVNRGFRAVCIREIQKNLTQSAKKLLEDKIRAIDTKLPKLPNIKAVEQFAIRTFRSSLTL